jgi:hypothetical protein
MSAVRFDHVSSLRDTQTILDDLSFGGSGGARLLLLRPQRHRQSVTLAHRQAGTARQRPVFVEDAITTLRGRRLRR